MARSGLRFSVVSFALLMLIAVSVPVAAHGNYLSVDSQVSADGEVRIEGVFMVTEGWVVLHADDDGAIGEVIGHEPPTHNTFVDDLAVSMNGSYWTTVTGNTSLWAVLHYDADNSGDFDPTADPPIGGADDPVHAIRLQVRNASSSAFVLAEDEHAQQSNSSAVVIREVSLPADGYLVIRTNSDGAPGDVVGHRALAAGRHDDVTVDLAEHYYHHQPEEFSLWAVVYRTDGDGTFDAGDAPVQVNGSLVASRFDVERANPGEVDHTHTPTATRTPESATSTPTPTATVTPDTSTASLTATPTEHDHDHDHDHDAETTASPTPATIATTATPSPTTVNPTPTSAGSPTNSPGQPGLGFLATLVALVLAVGYRTYGAD